MKSIRTKLLIPLLLLLLVAFAIMIGTIAWKTTDLVEKSVIVQSEGTVEGLTGTVRLFLDQYENSINMLSENTDILAYGQQKLETPGTANTQLSGVMAEYLESYGDTLSVYMGTPDGTMNNFPNPEMPDGYDPRERGWYQDSEKPENAETAVWSEPYVDASTGDYVVTVSKAVYNGQNQLLGVIGADINLATMAERVQSTDPGYDGYNIAFSKSGLGIVHPELQGEHMTQIPAVAAIVEQNEASGTSHYELDGEDRVMVFNTVPGVDWKVGSVYIKSNLLGLSKAVTEVLIWTAVVIIVLASAVIIYMVTRLIRPIKQIEQSASKVAEGDLTVLVPVETKDEAGQLAVSFNRMTERMNEILKKINHSVEEVRGSAENLSAVSEETNASSEQMTLAIDEIAAGVSRSAEESAEALERSNGIGRQIDTISSQSDEIAAAAKEAREANKTGTVQIQELSQSSEETKSYIASMQQVLGELEVNMASIETVIQAITNISAQTNLLALNASIEAARAGEHGRGFAVVAEEVRKLAEQSSAAAEEVQKTIARVQSSSKLAVEQMGKTRQNFDEQSAAVQETSQVFHQLSALVGTMENSIEAINVEIKEVGSTKDALIHTMTGIAAASEQSAAAGEEVSASAEEQLNAVKTVTEASEQLMELSIELKKVVNEFKLNA
ncbi:methyl-accepting chemotaxis protein [Domibacillus enclensis]|uniref:Methyl-accepting chemotaxis sensory transducer with TarH sensor n=2 Tax=Domibacillus enclensis TaxID=1017273 RepID=A0A1N6YYF9_9BACI|nr:methyl-accepting chemotaxis protein [Domibacillus enclensis]OXS76532.1 hypothetical protein B1B05_12670 [Domibacillus enclensis]SIR19624.1 methyl-accepting chemotaxis sensory transducer with TarH sensor [Domibacillus enclensis]